MKKNKSKWENKKVNKNFNRNNDLNDKYYAI